MKKILIVDDMMVSLMMTENILATQYITVCASSGKEAIEMYRKERPDMVLSDLRMPGMSGYELQLTLQEEYHTTIPFMFMTADPNEETESKGFDNGAMDFIRKPFRPDVLLRRIANILQTVEQIQILKKNAGTDALTGLLNKASSEEELKNICRASMGALMMIDLDSFKLVNDLHGHAMGDKILIAFADIIRSAVRPSDLLGRMGGDEFIAFCYGLDDEAVVSHKAEFINERLVEVAKKLMGEDMNIPLGASIGCVFVPAEGIVFEDLYKKADKALYNVKQHGKHGYSVYRQNQQINDMEISDVTNLSNIKLILEERNQKEEAAVLGLENFRAIYRFLRRATRDGRIADCILLMSLSPKEEQAVEEVPQVSEEPQSVESSEETTQLTEEESMPQEKPKVLPAEVGEAFLEVLKSTLRRSDTITQSSNNQFIIILYDIQLDNVHLVIERIDRNWQHSNYYDKVSYTYEFDLIKS